MTDKNERILEEIREWISAEAPGQDRVRDLSPPPLPLPNRQPALRARGWFHPYGFRFALQGAVACALFAFGYFLGSSGTQPPAYVESPPVQPAVQAAPKEKPKPRPIQTYTHEEDGRLVIETTLKDSGARALWVVDGRFELAKSDG